MDFIFVINGIEVLEILLEGVNIDIVLIDINMFLMDGLILLDNFRVFYFDIKVVIVFVYDDFDKIRFVMNRGVFDFLIKFIDF